MESGFSAKLIAFLSGFSGLTAYSAIFAILLLCGLGIPIPEDITLVAAGLLAGMGQISLFGAMVVGFVGVLFGDFFLFFLGRKLGDRAFKLPLLKKIFTPQRIDVAKAKINSNSSFICFTARFLPGLRAPIYITSGVMQVKPSTFMLLDGFAALISVPVWIYVGYWFGGNIDAAISFAKQAQIYIFLGVAVLIIGYYIYKKKFRPLRRRPPVKDLGQDSNL